jgi:CBS domain containing-hemolysin-like protein
LNNLLLILTALGLVALNGFFVAAEFGLVKLRQTRVQAIADTNGLRGRILAKVHGRLDAYLSACQLGITLASLGLGWIGEPAFANLLEPVLGWVGITTPSLVHGISFVFAFFVISFLHIVVGELAPKSLAIRNPENIALWTATPLYAFYWTMYPAIWMLNGCTSAVLRMAGLAATHEHAESYSADELKLILRSSRATDKVTHDEWKILAHTLDFTNLAVSDLMRPIGEVAAMSEDKSFQENMQTASQHRFSRYPYFSHDNTTVLGIVHLKDLFLKEQTNQVLEDLHHHLHPVVIVSPTLPAQDLFRRFRSGAPHFAMVGKKDGKPLGFITMDDMLGALVGQIRDEFRQSDNDWLLQSDGSLVGKGSLPLFTLERALGIDIESEETNSVGGLIIQTLDHMPTEGQKIDFAGFSVVVEKMNGPRITLLHVYPDTSNEAESDL